MRIRLSIAISLAAVISIVAVGAFLLTSPQASSDPLAELFGEQPQKTSLLTGDVLPTRYVGPSADSLGLTSCMVNHLPASALATGIVRATYRGSDFLNSSYYHIVSTRAEYTGAPTATEFKHDILQDAGLVFGNAVFKDQALKYDVTRDNSSNEYTFTFSADPADTQFWYCYFRQGSPFFQAFFQDVRVTPADTPQSFLGGDLLSGLGTALKGDLVSSSASTQDEAVARVQAILQANPDASKNVAEAMGFPRDQARDGKFAAHLTSTNRWREWAGRILQQADAAIQAQQQEALTRINGLTYDNAAIAAAMGCIESADGSSGCRAGDGRFAAYLSYTGRWKEWAGRILQQADAAIQAQQSSATAHAQPYLVGDNNFQVARIMGCIESADGFSGCRAGDGRFAAYLSYTGGWQTWADTLKNISTDPSHCTPPSVTNGSVGKYPDCAISCNGGYHQDGNSCVRNDDRTTPTTPTTPEPPTPTPTCSPSSVTNGSIGSYPGCAITCNGGYHQDGNSCVANTCSPSSVTNGSVGSYPTCTITCSGGYHLSGSSCVIDAINGACGTANGTTPYSAPTTDLCATGTTSSVTGTTGPWSWTCAGANGGTTATCGATQGDTTNPVYADTTTDYLTRGAATATMTGTLSDAQSGILTSDIVTGNFAAYYNDAAAHGTTVSAAVLASGTLTFTLSSISSDTSLTGITIKNTAPIRDNAGNALAIGTAFADTGLGAFVSPAVFDNGAQATNTSPHLYADLSAAAGAVAVGSFIATCGASVNDPTCDGGFGPPPSTTLTILSVTTTTHNGHPALDFQVQIPNDGSYSGAQFSIRNTAEVADTNNAKIVGTSGSGTTGQTFATFGIN